MSQETSLLRKNRDEAFLPYELEYIPEELQKRAELELFETEEMRDHGLKLFRSMLKEEKELNFQDEDLFLLSFLRARKFDVKRAFNLLKNFYAMLGKHDEIYYNIKFSDVKKSTESNAFGFSPYRDSEGSVIVVLRTACWNYHVDTLGDMIRALSCALFQANLSPATHIAGYKAIVDLSGLTLKHLPYISPTYVLLFAEGLQNCFPGRFRAVHVVNEDYIFSYVWAIMKKFLSKKIKERFHFHGKNVKKLHKYFSPSILPVEYEGDLPSLNNTQFIQTLEENFEYITHVFSHGYQADKLRAQKKRSS